MNESGFNEKVSDPEQALEWYKRAHKLGNTDASINIALYHINVCIY
jgi:TPR repeat protein